MVTTKLAQVWVPASVSRLYEACKSDLFYHVTKTANYGKSPKLTAALK